MTTIDTMALAYAAFQTCRHASEALAARSQAMLALCDDALREALATDLLTVTIDASRLEHAHAGDPARFHADAPVALPDDRRDLVRYCHEATAELQRLWGEEAIGAIRTLGYAMHIIPAAVTAAEGDRWRVFEPSRYTFCLRGLAYYWEDYSEAMREAVARVAATPRVELDRAARDDAYRVDFGGRRSR